MPTSASTALDEAAALQAEGRYLEAVDRLADANREHPDGRIERELVAARHAALDELEPGPGLDEWPRRLPDPFPDVAGRPPEISAAELTGDVLGGAIVNHGCLLVRGLVDQETAARMRDDIDTVFAACDARNDGAPLSETAPWFAPINPRPGYPVSIGERWWIREGGGVWTADSPRFLARLIDVFVGARIDEVLTDYLGERPALSVKKCTLRRVPITSGTDWHQDGAFLGEGIRTCNVWLTLSHCGDDAPGLDLVPARLPLVETGTEGAQFDWSVGPPVVERAAGDAGIVRPIFEAGDALLFDERFLHRTAVGPDMRKDRYAIETWFFAPSHYPGPQVPLAF
jgi:hypothetical protein